MMLVVLIDLCLFCLLCSVVRAAPILAPDLRNCNRTLYHVPTYAAQLECCAPQWDQPPIDFRFDESVSRSPLRVRRPVHRLDAEFVEKLNRGYELMKALPPEDPRSFYQQANIHCAYCDESYIQSNGKPFQAHESWLFFPFHRWYLYFHERILARLLQDDSFALPFWNYDHPDGATFPRIFMDYPALNNSFRDVAHLFPHIVSFRRCKNLSICRKPTREENIQTMHRVMIIGSKTPSLFLGKSYRFGDDRMPGGGLPEMIIHNNVHLWIGDHKRKWREDMGTYYSSGRDPIFYAHHASLDRLWVEWKIIEGHKDYEDPDFLDSEFAFYNENAELIKVKVRDSLNETKLGYAYEKVENLWLLGRPSSLTKGMVPKAAEISRFCKAGDLLQQQCSVFVPRHVRATPSDVEEILVIQGIQVMQWDRPAGFDIFINLPHGDACEMLNCTEYVGSFTSVPQTSHAHGGTGRTLRLGIGVVIEELQLSNERSLLVTVAPMSVSEYSPVTLWTEMVIEYEDVHPGLASI
eukprot:c23753_g1_i1 orf=185-1750(+)